MREAAVSVVLVRVAARSKGADFEPCHTRRESDDVVERVPIENAEAEALLGS